MKKIIVFLLLLSSVKLIVAQPLNNEWIDYSKAYYKFKVGTTGLYRINQSTLASAGLATTSADQFQLWRNGMQVPLYTSIATGTFGTTDFVEFWGEMNDGKLDKLLYKNTANQLSDKLSLQTDTAAYFLTTNTNVANNLRYTLAINNVAANTLPAETNFLYTQRFNFKEIANRGYAVNVGENVYASLYDVAEFLSTKDIDVNNAYKIALKNLYVFAAATTPAKLKIGYAGNASKTRNIIVDINNTNFINKLVSGYNATIDSVANISLAVFNGTTDTAKIAIVTNDIYDRVVASFVEIQYPRQFNFDGNSNFEFQLPATTTGYFLKIANFNNGGLQPILFDAVNLKYYEGDISNPGFVQFALPATVNATKYMLVSRGVANINTVTNINAKKFVDYAAIANQGDYLIVSHKTLMNATNAIDQYKQYRSSIAGGSFNAKVYDIDELVDQFAYGIKKHPLSIRNFLRMANASFTTKPAYVFFIGKGVTYNEYRMLESNPNIEKQNLVPTFGWPASDALLVSPNNTEPSPMLPFGRLSAITQQEVIDYLDKVKQYDEQATSPTQTIANKAWMKQLIHVAGGKNDGENNLFTYYLNSYENIIKDTSFGGTAKNFNKTTGNETSPVTQADMINAFARGTSLVTYFGHSAASGLAYNLNDPGDYNNYKKYPIFLINGCTAGNIYDFDAVRFSNINNVSEKWVFAKNKGSVGFIATSHFGLTSYLDFYSAGFYHSLSKTGYNKSIGQNMMEALAKLKASATFNDFFGNTHGEQFVLHGDPAIKIYAHTKPDFVIEDDQVAVTPTFISIANKNFSFKAYFYNIGKASGDSVKITIKRTYPNGNTDTIFNKKIFSVRYKDSLLLTIPIDPLRDKGNNSFSVCIDNDNKYDELSETNNCITKSFVIFEDELKPVYPHNYAIVNKSQIKLAASTANPLVTLKQYVMEMDTTTLFNSSFKITKTISSIGGLLEFDPSISFVDSTVYYWRVAPVPASGIYNWNNSSFIYLKNAVTGGYNQSHFYQQNESYLYNIATDTTARKFDFPTVNQSLTIRNGVWPYSGSVDIPYSISLNDAINSNVQGICWRGQNVTFTVYNPSTLIPIYNVAANDPVGQFGSLGYVGSVPGREYDFAYNTNTLAGRNSARDFMDNNIPDGSYVVVRSIILDDPYWPTPTYAQDWKQDQIANGGNNTLYNRLQTAGFADIDSFNRKRAFGFAYQKNNGTFTPVWKFSQDSIDNLSLKVIVQTHPNNGTILSPTFGPVQKWYKMLWMGNRNDLQDIVSVKILGVKTNNTVDTLQTLTELQNNNDISAVDAAIYPSIKLYIQVKDTVNLSAYQLKYWRLLADALPEGALAPNIKFTFKDSLDAGENQNITIAFKNASDMPYLDSLNVTMQITDNNNVTQNIAIPKLKKLLPGDTTSFSTTIATQNLVGKNSFYVNVNPTNNPQEQSLDNNFAFRNFVVKNDETNPILDITFDGVHILNGDIVSSKPNIRVALKDESKFLELNDTALVTVQLKLPNGDIRQYKYGTDTLQFIPANVASGSNTATVSFNPSLLEDGNYELYVKAKDKSNNNAGPQQYRVLFTINNKPAISNVFNYPNPFTTSTAFVFTLTGTQVPQNLKIQILTITGKIVKEITKAELGDIHIGRNITDYKWNGTDTYGQQLGNGVYLYRVITNLDGKALDKFQTKDLSGYDVDTDKYFKAGYGKMYLMR